MKKDDRKWYCSPCNSDIFPFNSVDDDETFINTLYDAYSDIPLLFHDIENMIFNPLSLNTKLDSQMYDIDPDIQFYNDINNPSRHISQYYLEDAFNHKVKENPSDCLSMLHINIRSIQNKINEYDCYMSLLHQKFSIIGVSETWLTEETYGLYEFEDYSHTGLYREGKKGGGVSIFVREGILQGVPELF